MTENNAVLFEDDYIFRNYKSVTSNNDIALTEFIANAWDAGATNVNITLPTEEGDLLIIEDNGVGMTNDDFLNRWMLLNYDRQKRQGRMVILPTDTHLPNRIAYGRHGIGRHGMFCFADDYIVETWRDGVCNIYEIMLSSGPAPYIISAHHIEDREGHGTKIYTKAIRHLPDAQSMSDVLSARFMYDPNFIVKINGKVIDLSQHKGVIINKKIHCANGVVLSMTVIDAEKTAVKSQQHGIAFWVAGRLVGQPSWTHGKITFLDGRLRAAKRYTIIISSDDLIDDVLPDWSGFSDSINMAIIYNNVKTEVDAFIKSAMHEHTRELCLEAITNSSEGLSTLNVSGQRTVAAFLEKYTESNPIISSEALNNAVEAIISIEQARCGRQLLNQLSQMSSEQIDKLSEILSNWDINDIATVIGEIDRRIIVIEAIQRLHDKKTADELHTLHPLILSARWLFGAQFDSPMFTSNETLSTIMKKFFKDDEYDLSMISNPRRRPDIFCLKNYTINAVCTDKPDMQAAKIMKPDQILIIELKRGGSEITIEEVGQVEHYVRQIKKSAAIHKDASIEGFIVGSTIGDIDPERIVTSGVIHAVTYSQLVETANCQLFRLRDKLKSHYDSMGQESIVEKALREGFQLKMQLEE